MKDDTTVSLSINGGRMSTALTIKEFSRRLRAAGKTLKEKIAMSKKRPETIEPELIKQIMAGYDALTAAQAEAATAKENAKTAKDAEEAAQAHLNGLLREARFGDEGLPFAKKEAAGA